MLIKFSTTNAFFGKPTINKELKIISSPVGTRGLGALSYNFRNHETSFEQLFQWLTVDGYPYAPNLKPGGHKHRNNFYSSSVVMVDIDHGMKISELLVDRFYKAYGSGYYTTANHTDHKQRFRVLFLLESSITSADNMVLMYKRIISYYGTTVADKSCKDASRMFFGSINAQHKELTDRFIPAGNIRNIINAQRRIEHKQKRPVVVRTNHEPLSDPFKERVIELAHDMYLGNYPDWRNFGWGLKDGGFDVSDYIYITHGMMSSKTSEDAARVWNSGNSGGISLGTCIFMLKQRHGQDCFKGIKSMPTPNLTTSIDGPCKRVAESVLDDDRPVIEYVEAIAGSGKTFCTVRYITKEYAKKNKIIMVVPTNKLMDQIAEDFDECSLNVTTRPV